MTPLLGYETTYANIYQNIHRKLPYTQSKYVTISYRKCQLRLFKLLKQHTKCTKN